MSAMISHLCVTGLERVPWLEWKLEPATAFNAAASAQVFVQPGNLDPPIYLTPQQAAVICSAFR